MERGFRPSGRHAACEERPLIRGTDVALTVAGAGLRGAIIGARVIAAASVLAYRGTVAAWHRIPPRWARRLLWAGLLASSYLAVLLRHTGLIWGGIMWATVENWCFAAPFAWALFKVRGRWQREWVESRGRLGSPVRVSQHAAAEAIQTAGIEANAGRLDRCEQRQDATEGRIAALEDSLAAAYRAAEMEPPRPRPSLTLIITEDDGMAGAG